MKLPQQSKPTRIINDFAFGKAGNNAIDIMIAAGLFKDGVKFDGALEETYIQLQHKIYNVDEQSKERLKQNE